MCVVTHLHTVYVLTVLLSAVDCRCNRPASQVIPSDSSSAIDKTQTSSLIVDKNNGAESVSHLLYNRFASYNRLSSTTL
jgi:hypothetical protein